MIRVLIVDDHSVVRRGLDVLAELGEEGEEEVTPLHAKALVTFRDAPDCCGTAARWTLRPKRWRPATSLSSARGSASPPTD